MGNFHHNVDALPGPEEVMETGWDDAYGNYVIIRNLATNTDVFYAHLNQIFVIEGQTVDKETVIGEIGKSGSGSRDRYHLHMEVWFNQENVKMNWWDGASEWVQSDDVSVIPPVIRIDSPPNR